MIVSGLSKKSGLPIILLLLLFLCIHLHALDPNKKLTDYMLTVLTMRDGLPQNTTLSVVQTRDGYIWIGTHEGLARFDGVTFTPFNKVNTPEITNNSILTIIEDRQGNLWSGTPNGLLRYREGSWRRFTCRDGLPSEFILTLFEDQAGSLWIGTTRGLIRMENGEAKESYSARDGLPHDHILALCEDQTGKIWIGTEGGGLSCLYKGVIQCAGMDGKPDLIIWTLFTDRSGAVWAGTSASGLARYKDGSFRIFTRDDGLSSNCIRSIYEDKEGVLWIGTDNRGLNRFLNGSFSALTTRQGLSNDSIRSICEDNEGNLWLATYGRGLNLLKDFPFSVFNTGNGFPIEMSRCVFEDNQERIWVGTVGNGLVQLSSKGSLVFDSDDGLLNNRVWSIAQSQDDAIWFGTYGGGLHRLKDGKVRAYTTRNGLSNNIVRAVFVDRDDNVWAGTNGGGVDVLLHDGRFINYSTRNGLSGDFVYCISQDQGGAIWVGTYNGRINKIQDGKIRVFGPEDGLAPHAVWAIYPDMDGAYWIGTNSGGLNRFKDGKFVNITIRDGLYNDVAFQILEDNSGNLWMNCNQGFYRVRKKELNDFANGRIQKISCFSLGRSDGLKNVECAGPGQPAGFRSRSGKLWFPTTRGVVRIDPGDERINQMAPPVKIEKVLVDGKSYPPGKSFRLKPGINSMAFSYTALSFKVPGKVRFKYKVEGFDQDWSESVTRRSAYYTNLPPGKHVFKVIACNNDGVWNLNGARTEFFVEPFFYQTVAFYVCCSLFVLFLGISFHFLRLKSLKSRQRELEHQVSVRTKELFSANLELQKANEFKTELMNIAAHDLKNPIQGILGFAELIRIDIGEESFIAEYSDLISQASREMLLLINEMLDASRFDSSQIQLKTQDVYLNDLLKMTIDRFQPQLRKKEQNIHVEIKDDCVVNGEPDRLREIISNLISNAIKFSPKNRTIYVNLAEERDRVILRVRDEGPGLSDDDLKKLFNKFQRLTPRPTGGETSTGLGLFIVSQLVKLHQGRVWVESRLGEGSTFIVDLPSVRNTEKE